MKRIGRRRGSPSRRAPLQLVSTVTLTLLVLVSPVASTHAAETTGPVSGVEVRIGGASSTSIELADLYPGPTQEAVLFLDGPQTSVVRSLAVGLSDVRDFENGCSRPEINAGDTTCGPGPDQGELSQWLLVTFTAGSEVADPAGRACRLDEDTTTVGGLLHDLGTATAPLAVAGPNSAVVASSWCLVVAFGHEDRGAIDNLTQGDSVQFDLRLDFAGGLPTDIGGEVVDRGGDVDGRTGSGRGRDVVTSRGTTVGGLRVGLPRTDVSFVEFLALEWFLLTVGTIATQLRRRPLSLRVTW